MNKISMVCLHDSYFFLVRCHLISQSKVLSSIKFQLSRFVDADIGVEFGRPLMQRFSRRSTFPEYSLVTKSSIDQFPTILI